MEPSNDPTETEYAASQAVDGKIVIMTVYQHRENYDICMAIIHGVGQSEKIRYRGLQIAWHDFNSFVRQLVYGTLEAPGRIEGHGAHAPYYDEIKDYTP